MNNSRNVILDNKYTKGGGGLPSDTGPYIGVVMNNHDPNRTGRIEVWLKSFSSSKQDDPSSWRTVSYLSPFYGNTPHEKNDTSNSKFNLNAQSYGMWFTSPDVGVEVICIFINGDPNYGFYIGYVPQPQMNHMIPAVGARPNNKIATPNTDTETSAFANASQLPTVEINRSEENLINADYYNSERPVHSLLSAQLWKQGTLTDNVRGPIGTSAQRESPSYAYGISTPGRPVYNSPGSPLYEGTLKPELEKGNVSKEDVKVTGRRSGHSFVMDDGDIDGNDVLIRFRTSSGHQITMSDDGGAIYIQHANGLTWIELGNEGTVDVFSTNSINLRSQGEINIHADKDINFFSGQDINMFAERNIKLEARNNFDIIGRKKTALYSKEKILIKSDGSLSTQSVLNTSIKADANIVENGALILMNSGGADTINPPEFIPHSNLPDTQIEGPTGWTSKPGVLDSIVTRAPTHEPYEFHNQGVPIPITVGAPSAPPSAPAPSKTQGVLDNSNAQPPIEQPIETANVVEQVNEVNPTKDIGAMDKSTIAATLSQQSKSIGQQVNTISDKGLGSFAILPKHFGDLKLLKPGIIDLASTSVGDAFELMKDPSVFTGKDGINSLQEILSSESLQGDIVQKNMSKTFDTLKQKGFITGQESAKDTASLLGASMVGTKDEVVKWISSSSMSNTTTSIADNSSSDVTVSGIEQQGIIDDTISAVNSGVNQSINTAMTLVSKASGFATNSAKGPGKEVIDLVTKSSGAVKGITNAVNNVDLSSIDNAVNDITNNINIPSASFISDKIKSAIDPAFSINKQLKSLVTDGLPNLEDITKGISGGLSDLTSDIPGIDTIKSGIKDLGVGDIKDLGAGTVTKGIDRLVNSPVSYDKNGAPLYSASSTILSSALSFTTNKIIANKIPLGVKQITRFL